MLILTILFWSGNFVLGRALHEKVPPAALSFWRWFTAWLILLPFVLRPLVEQGRLILLSWKSIALFGLLGVAGFSTLVYAGLTTTTSTNGILLNTTSPVFIVLISRLFFEHKMSWRQALGVAVAFTGVVVIVTRGDMSMLLSLRLHRGDIFVLAGVLCWALYTACLHLRPAELKPLSFIGATVGIGTLAILPFFLWEMARGATVTLTPAVLAGIFYLAMFPSILAYIFWNHAVTLVGASKAGFFIYLMPVFGVLLSYVFLGESLHMYHFSGIFLILAGIYATTSRPETAR